MSFRRVVLIALIAVTGLFLVQNLATTETAFLWWSFRAPRAILLFLAFAVGVAVGVIASRTRGPRRPMREHPE